ncbi:MAG: ABC transporter ATP-binding protein, partial [Clostridiales bacterium]|nr:ABC transporter ATP-binding protein [Clostridiales bacterium]
TEEVMKILKMCVNEFNQTLVMITHNDDIANIADRVITIKDGKVLS